jgi:hypothetical protein
MVHRAGFIRESFFESFVQKILFECLEIFNFIIFSFCDFHCGIIDAV